MMNKGLKKIPNILSISRIILSPIMLAMADRPPALAALILLIGLTDMADGFIARRYHCRSASGARLSIRSATGYSSARQGSSFT
ncbi:CDP-alcohol phosphatidyltransferase family protein [Tannerella forsythia]|uniref:CDP-alcohol phosphatidyltransferase family protein n=1 Tax=Tannerella forsythia TaxID=28112 RepID=UPI0028E671BB|nr:CDP-alcohol phosphatidyltransferase family protein [Tannerella forsythia]